MLILIFTGLLSIYAGLYYYRASCARQADNALSIAHKCGNPPLLDTGRWPLGLELIMHAFRSAREQRLLRVMTDIVQKTGPTFEQRLLGFRGIDTVDPINVEAILSKQFDDFDLGERRRVFAPLLGNGIFTQDGAAWAHSRSLLKPAFGHQEDSMVQIGEATEQLLALIPVGGQVDLQPLFFRFTLDTTAFLLFGRRLGALQENGDAGEHAFAVAFDKGQDFLARRGRLGGLYWLIDGADFRKQCKLVHEHVDRAIAQALEKEEYEGEKSTHSILQDLVRQTSDRKTLREQCLNVLLAGRDTTACLLSWTFRLLARDPARFELCRAEILDSCGTTGPITRPALKSMKYLDAVLKEVLRLYPSVPINSRTALVTTTLPTGGGPNGDSPILIHKGEAVGYAPYVMHRRQEIFGPDPEAFKPERWLENGGRLFSKVGFGYVPFNGGPRMCLGQAFALLEAGYVVARLLQRFSKLSLPKGEPIERIGDERQKLTLVLCSADGCKVVLS